MGFFDNNRLLDLLTNYLRTQFELIKLDIQEALEALLIKIFKFIFAAFALGIAFLFVLLTIAFALNEYLDSSYLGFLIMSIVSLIIGGGLFWSFKQQNTFEKTKVDQVIEDTIIPENHESETE
ncbi:MAG: hypothetical protein RI995_271 [Bacteroidota bacterium]|jgi:uncharacterized membrane protein YqjE